jgi:hypothetical protein
MVCVHKVVLRKTDLSFDLRKKKYFGAKNKTFYCTCFVFFFYTDHVQCFFCETLRTHMDYEDVHVNFMTLQNMFF